MLFFSNFKKINWSLTKPYLDISTVDNKLKSINKSIASSHHNVIPSLIALLALSSYNSAAMMFGIDKSKILQSVCKILRSYVGDVDDNLVDVMWERKQFVTKCCGQNQLNLSENRSTILKNKTVDHSVQKVWMPHSIDKPSSLQYGHSHVFIFFLIPPLLARLFQQYSPNEILDRHKNKLT